MKTGNYTLQDKGFFRGLAIIEDSLGNIPHALVGGTGVQATIANIMSEDGKIGIENIVSIDLLLRRTDDFDMAFNSDESELMGTLLYLDHMFSDISEVKRVGDKNLKMKVRTGKSGSEITNINLNYETKPEDFKGLPNHYYQTIESARNLRLKNGNNVIYVPVASPEYIVASKLTRYSEKDMLDVYNLLNVMAKYNVGFDYNQVKSILASAGKEQNFALLPKIKRQAGKNYP